ncbi:hypothetical protein JAAARDRAFT_200748 [Jaapia argillacea MUCL 33604]|uniref:Uncharacterized protein n=1 Tax=Jaapia argillacea MUCL 33604 TaxID=933084 RepID=A0A067P3Q2_9AGAM|nr:hypothetical protein JAAARDRAFT_200748 [Jaapia argillacea MUCL 33604]
MSADVGWLAAQSPNTSETQNLQLSLNRHSQSLRETPSTSGRSFSFTFEIPTHHTSDGRDYAGCDQSNDNGHQLISQEPYDSSDRAVVDYPIQVVSTRVNGGTAVTKEGVTVKAPLPLEDGLLGDQGHPTEGTSLSCDAASRHDPTRRKGVMGRPVLERHRNIVSTSLSNVSESPYPKALLAPKSSSGSGRLASSKLPVRNDRLRHQVPTPPWYSRSLRPVSTESPAPQNENSVPDEPAISNGVFPTASGETPCTHLTHSFIPPTNLMMCIEPFANYPESHPQSPWSLQSKFPPITPPPDGPSANPPLILQRHPSFEPETSLASAVPGLPPSTFAPPESSMNIPDPNQRGSTSTPILDRLSVPTMQPLPLVLAGDSNHASVATSTFPPERSANHSGSSLTVSSSMQEMDELLPDVTVECAVGENLLTATEQAGVTEVSALTLFGERSGLGSEMVLNDRLEDTTGEPVPTRCCRNPSPHRSISTEPPAQDLGSPFAEQRPPTFVPFRKPASFAELHPTDWSNLQLEQSSFIATPDDPDLHTFSIPRSHGCSPVSHISGSSSGLALSSPQHAYHQAINTSRSSCMALPTQPTLRLPFHHPIPPTSQLPPNLVHLFRRIPHNANLMLSPRYPPILGHCTTTSIVSRTADVSLQGEPSLFLPMSRPAPIQRNRYTSVQPQSPQDPCDHALISHISSGLESHSSHSSITLAADSRSLVEPHSSMRPSSIQQHASVQEPIPQPTVAYNVCRDHHRLRLPIPDRRNRSPTSRSPTPTVTMSTQEPTPNLSELIPPSAPIPDNFNPCSALLPQMRTSTSEMEVDPCSWQEPEAPAIPTTEAPELVHLLYHSLTQLEKLPKLLSKTLDNICTSKQGTSSHSDNVKDAGSDDDDGDGDDDDDDGFQPLPLARTSRPKRPIAQGPIRLALRKFLHDRKVLPMGSLSEPANFDAVTGIEETPDPLPDADHLQLCWEAPLSSDRNMKVISLLAIALQTELNGGKYDVLKHHGWLEMSKSGVAKALKKRLERIKRSNRGVTVVAAARTRRGLRRHTIYAQRVQITQRNRNRGPEWTKSKGALKRLGASGTSGDETDPGKHVIKRVRHVELGWRAPSLGSLMRTMDTYQPAWQSVRGNKRLPRKLEARATKYDRVVSGLPRNWYNQAWLDSLTPSQRISLAMTPEEPIPVLDALKGTVLTHVSGKGPLIAPLPPDRPPDRPAPMSRRHIQTMFNQYGDLA